MLIKVLVLLISSIISGVLYRAGGIGKPFNTKIRDLGCSLIALISLWLLVGFKFSHWWAYLITFGLMFGSLTTYWDEFFGYDNFYAHGFFIGLSTFPLILTGIQLSSILTYSISLMILMGLWSKWISKDWLEEFGRGFLICLLLLIYKVR